MGGVAVHIQLRANTGPVLESKLYIFYLCRMHFKAKPKLGNVSCAATVMCQYWAGIGPIVAASAQYAPSAGTYIYMFAAVICVSGIVKHRVPTAAGVIIQNTCHGKMLSFVT